MAFEGFRRGSGADAPDGAEESPPWAAPHSEASQGSEGGGSQPPPQQGRPGADSEFYPWLRDAAREAGGAEAARMGDLPGQAAARRSAAKQRAEQGGLMPGQRAASKRKKAFEDAGRAAAERRAEKARSSGLPGRAAARQRANLSPFGAPDGEGGGGGLPGRFAAQQREGEGVARQREREAEEMGGLLPGQGNAREREARLSARARSQAKRGEPLPGRLNAIRREKGSREKGSLIRGKGEIAGEIGGEVGATAVEGAAPVGGGAGDAAEALGGGGRAGWERGLGRFRMMPTPPCARLRRVWPRRPRE